MRKITFCILAGVTVLGFGSKIYYGPFRPWFNYHLAGVFYEIFWILLLFLIFPYRRSLSVVPIAVFTITCILELLQLWHPSALEMARSSLLGAALIGATFDCFDLPHYLLGCIIGWLLVSTIFRRC